jgi:heme/copper-type cytochrome/quinol oxidase subunit 4
LSREDHRKYDALLQQIRQAAKAPSSEGISRGDVILWCLAAALAIALFLIGLKSAQGSPPYLVRFLLFALLASLVHPILNIHWIRKGTKYARIAKSVAALLAAFIPVAALGWWVTVPLPPITATLDYENILSLPQLSPDRKCYGYNLFVSAPYPDTGTRPMPLANLSLLQFQK